MSFFSAYIANKKSIFEPINKTTAVLSLAGKNNKEITDASTPSPSTFKSPVNEVVSKPLAGQALANEVTVTSEDALYEMVVSSVSQGKDLVLALNSNIERDGLADRVIKILDATGYSGYISGIEYNLNNSTFSLRYNYKDGKENFLLKINAVNSKVKEIASKIIKPGMSDFEKELAVHDYVVNNSVYDYKNLSTNTLPNDSFTAYGNLIKGVSVCSGYAEAVYRILNSVGVQTLIITGTANNVPHAWNIVKIDGAFYHLDATFDDPVSSSGNTLTYNYFNVSSAEISKSHVWNTSDYPKCTSSIANYFVFNKLFASNNTELSNLIKSGLLKRQAAIRVKTSSYNPSLYTSDSLYQVLKDNPAINYVDISNGFSYAYSEDSCIIEFYVNYK
jgi:hypothetical protein